MAGVSKRGKGEETGASMGRLLEWSRQETMVSVTVMVRMGRSGMDGNSVHWRVGRT